MAITPKLIRTKEDPKNQKEFGRRNPKRRYMFKVLQLSMLDNHELNLFLVSTYLVNVIRPAITFLSCDLKLKLP